MELKASPLTRGDSLEKQEGHFVGAIGGFSNACVQAQVLCPPISGTLTVSVPQPQASNSFSAEFSP